MFYLYPVPEQRIWGEEQICTVFSLYNKYVAVAGCDKWRWFRFVQKVNTGGGDEGGGSFDFYEGIINGWCKSEDGGSGGDGLLVIGREV